jgi:hypothetical protein
MAFRTHIFVPHVEKLADFLVLLLPIFPLTSLGTIHGGLLCSAVLELNIQRCIDLQTMQLLVIIAV